MWKEGAVINWTFIEKHVPGAYVAWKRDVGVEPSAGGLTGKPLHAVAWLDGPPWQYWVFNGKRWEMRTAPTIERKRPRGHSSRCLCTECRPAPHERSGGGE